MKKNLNQDQAKALEILESGVNTFLSGEAGTGKSTVLSTFISRNIDKKNILVCAPTGIAALNVNGSTLHRTFKIPLGNIMPCTFNRNPKDYLLKSEVIIIDEISMCRYEQFEYVIRSIKHAEEISGIKKQIILVGDFYQLPPIFPSNPKDKAFLYTHYKINTVNFAYPFNSQLWWQQNFKNIVLKEVMRQDGTNQKELDFKSNLNKIRTGDLEGLIWFNENISSEAKEQGIYLCGKNSRVNQINSEKLALLNTTGVCFRSKITGRVSPNEMPAEENLMLKVGMRVMTLVNNFDVGYQNGSLGNVVSIERGVIKVKLDNGEIVDVKPFTWEVKEYAYENGKVATNTIGTFTQFPLRCAYAITIHKAQGQTFESVNIEPECFNPGQLYVALSRVRSIDGLSLQYRISPRWLITSPTVIDFYNYIDSIEANRELAAA